MACDLIYLDHNATTPIDPVVAAAISAANLDYQGNPASQHAAGRTARRALENARIDIVRQLGGQTSGMEADRLVFTSGGTEANNLALMGLAAAKPHGTVFFSGIEHPSIVMMAEPLARAGHRVRKIPALTNGQVDVGWLADNLSPEAAVVSVMLANNETGVIQPISEIAELCESRGILLHCDAVQAAGKIPVHFRTLNLAAMTITAHKIGGPIGIGGLLLRHGVKLSPQLFGGFQQAGLRPGTESVPLAIGLNIAVQEWTRHRMERTKSLESWRNAFESLVLEQCEGVEVVGRESPRLPHVSCLAFLGIDRQALFLALDRAGVCCSTGSACASGSSEPSATLVAMGLPEATIRGSLRFSFGVSNTAANGPESVDRILKAVKHLRRAKNLGISS